MSNQKQKIIKKREDQDQSQEIDPELLKKNLSTFFEREGELLTKKEFERIQDLTLRGKSLESHLDSIRSDLKISAEEEVKIKYRSDIRRSINHLHNVVTDHQKDSYTTNIKLAGFSQIEREFLPGKVLEFLNIFLTQAFIRSKEDFIYKDHRKTFFEELHKLIEDKEEIVYLGNDAAVLDILREMLNLKNNNNNWSKENANYKDLILLAAQTAVRHFKKKYQLAECQDCGKTVFKSDLVEAWYRDNKNVDFNSSEKYFICRKCAVENADQIYDIYEVNLPKEHEVVSKAKLIRFLRNEKELINDKISTSRVGENLAYYRGRRDQDHRILKAIEDFRSFKEVD